MAVVGMTIVQFVLYHLRYGTYGNNVTWVDETKGVFKVKWINRKNTKKWTPSLGDIFRDWAQEKQDHTYLDDFQKLKQRFRSALNSKKKIFKYLKHLEGNGYRYYQIDLAAAEREAQKQQRKQSLATLSQVLAQCDISSDVDNSVSQTVPSQFQHVSFVLLVGNVLPQQTIVTVPDTLSINSDRIPAVPDPAVIGMLEQPSVIPGAQNDHCADAEFDLETCNSYPSTWESSPDSNTYGNSLHNTETPVGSNILGNCLANVFATGNENLENYDIQSLTCVNPAVPGELFHNAGNVSFSQPESGYPTGPGVLEGFFADSSNNMEADSSGPRIPEKQSAFFSPFALKQSLECNNTDSSEMSFLDLLLLDESSIDLSILDGIELPLTTSSPDSRDLLQQPVSESPVLKEEKSPWATSDNDQRIVMCDKMLSEATLYREMMNDGLSEPFLSLN